MKLGTKKPRFLESGLFFFSVLAPIYFGASAASIIDRKQTANLGHKQGNYYGNASCILSALSVQIFLTGPRGIHRRSYP